MINEISGKINILIASLGSIGRRHLTNLYKLRPETQIHILRMTNRPIPDGMVGSSISFHRDLSFISDLQLDGAILCSPAPQRRQLAIDLIARGVPLLIEKPIAVSAAIARQIADASIRSKTLVAVSYQMRYLPIIRAIRSRLASGSIGRLLSIRVSVGQYLPSWRPDTDYRASVSAQAELGGGVLLELSHEFDYILWLFGTPKTVTATLGQISDLDINVPDFAEIILNYGVDGPVISLHLDILDQMPTRTCRLIGTQGTLFADLISGELSINSITERSNSCSELYLKDRNQAYLDILNNFLNRIEGGESDLPNAAESVAVLELVEAVSLSSRLGRTISLE